MDSRIILRLMCKCSTFQALDSVLLPYVVRKHPEYTYSVLVELKKRGALR